MSLLEDENHLLLTTFEINRWDLQANREGHVSPTQRQIILRESVRVLLGHLTLLMFLAFWSIVLDLDDALIRTLTLLVVGGLLVLMSRRLKNGLNDYNSKQVRRIEGKAERWKVTHRGGGVSYYVKIESFTFKVTENVYEVISASIRYEAYYAPSARTLLALQALQIETDD